MKRILLNAGLRKAIDGALEDVPRSQDISIKWVEGHVGISGNERTDELAGMGRQIVLSASHLPSAGNERDERYRQIMGAD